MRVTRDPAELRAAERIVLPGVGAFGVAMERLREYGLVEPLNEQVLERRVPFLGICLGHAADLPRAPTSTATHDGPRLDPGVGAAHRSRRQRRCACRTPAGTT